jgi:putative membrane protein
MSIRLDGEMTMRRFPLYTVSALALGAMALSGCNKSSDPAQSAMSDSAASAAPADGIPTLAASSGDSADANAAPGTDAATYLTKAGAGDLFEIESSRTILKTTQDPKVKSFAQMMVTDHEASTAMLKKAAKSADINVPSPHLTPDQQQTLNSIKAAKGADADKIYVGAQRDGHAAALMLHKTYAANGNVEALKAAATKIAPVVQQHIEMLDKMGQ